MLQPIATRVHAGKAAEDPGKILAGTETALKGDIGNTPRRLAEELLGPVHAKTINQNQRTVAC